LPRWRAAGAAGSLCVSAAGRPTPADAVASASPTGPCLHERRSVPRALDRPRDRRSNMGATANAERVRTVVIGGGQAGLSVGYHLKRRGVPFVIPGGPRRRARRVAGAMGLPPPVHAGPLRRARRDAVPVPAVDVAAAAQRHGVTGTGASGPPPNWCGGSSSRPPPPGPIGGTNRGSITARRSLTIRVTGGPGPAGRPRPT
jgi:hypothetical protein